MTRSMWRGAIQFGLVTIPVRLYAATEARAGLNFNLLHRTCLTRVQMKTYCPYHEETIARSDTVRGFEYTKGQYVVLEEGDFEAVPLTTVRSIEIELFVDRRRDGHGAQFVKSAYYLEPEPIGRKAFFLLKSVLAEEGLSAVCKVVIKDREVLAAIDPFARTMLLTTLHWPDEVRSTEDLELPEEEQQFKPAEVAMAKSLVAAMTAEFDPAQFHDEYREALLRVIEAKVAGQEVAAPALVEAPGAKLVDLMSVLEASVAAAREGRRVAPVAVAAPAPTPAAEARKQGRAKAQAAATSAAPARTSARAKAEPAGGEAFEESSVPRARRKKSA